VPCIGGRPVPGGRFGDLSSSSLSVSGSRSEGAHWVARGRCGTARSRWVASRILDTCVVLRRESSGGILTGVRLPETHVADDAVDRGSRSNPPSDDDARHRAEQPTAPGPAGQPAKRVDPPPRASPRSPTIRPQFGVTDPVAADDGTTLTEDELAAHALADAELHSSLPTDIDATDWTEHDVAEWHAQQSLHPDVSSPTSDLPSGLGGMAWSEQDIAEWQAQQSLWNEPDASELPPDVDPSGWSEHDAAEWQAQQSLPLDESEVGGAPDDGTYRGSERATRHFRIRVILGAGWPSVPKTGPAPQGKRLRSGVAPAIAGFEIQNRLTGHIGTYFFGGAGPGIGGAISAGRTGAWKDFSTKDPIHLRTFQGVVRLAELTLIDRSVISTIQFGGVFVRIDHDTLLQQLWWGDGLDLSDITESQGLNVNWTPGWLELHRTRQGTPDPPSTLSDWVEQGMREAVDRHYDRTATSFPEPGTDPIAELDHAIAEIDAGASLLPDDVDLTDEQAVADWVAQSSLLPDDTDPLHALEEGVAGMSLLPATEAWEWAEAQSLTNEALEELTGLDLDGSEAFTPLQDDVDISDPHSIAEYHAQSSLLPDDVDLSDEHGRAEWEEQSSLLPEDVDASHAGGGVDIDGDGRIDPFEPGYPDEPGDPAHIDTPSESDHGSAAPPESSDAAPTYEPFEALPPPDPGPAGPAAAG
jgi:hypothetical protein